MKQGVWINVACGCSGSPYTEVGQEVVLAPEGTGGVGSGKCGGNQACLGFFSSRRTYLLCRRLFRTTALLQLSDHKATETSWDSCENVGNGAGGCSVQGRPRRCSARISQRRPKLLGVLVCFFVLPANSKGKSQAYPKMLDFSTDSSRHQFISSLKLKPL